MTWLIVSEREFARVFLSCTYRGLKGCVVLISDMVTPTLRISSFPTGSFKSFVTTPTPPPPFPTSDPCFNFEELPPRTTVPTVPLVLVVLYPSSSSSSSSSSPSLPSSSAGSRSVADDYRCRSIIPPSSGRMM